jgi:hypothetical protein
LDRTQVTCDGLVRFLTAQQDALEHISANDLSDVDDRIWSSMKSTIIGFEFGRSLVSDEGVKGWIQKRRDTAVIKTVGLDNCPRITDRTVTKLARAGQLERLSIANNPHLTAKSVRMVAEQCLLIQHVNLSGCQGVDHASVEYLLSHAKNLTSLDIRHCPNVNAAALASLVTFADFKADHLSQEPIERVDQAGPSVRKRKRQKEKEKE